MVVRCPAGQVVRCPAGQVVRYPAGQVARCPSGQVVSCPDFSDCKLHKTQHFLANDLSCLLRYIHFWGVLIRGVRRFC